MLLTPLGKFQGTWLLGCIVKAYLVLEETDESSSRVGISCWIPSHSEWQLLVFLVFWNLEVLIGVQYRFFFSFSLPQHGIAFQQTLYLLEIFLSGILWKITGGRMKEGWWTLTAFNHFLQICLFALLPST